ncbi:hypothetical protein [Luteolibacter soli]|uniref:Uncharacterized protein n=1 Tax=Luteolibacter soli TaxID=3135280 RepID=A0ABU9AVB8_9BACT
MNSFFQVSSAAAISRGVLRANPARSVTRCVVPEDRASFQRIIKWACALSEEEVEERLKYLRGHFGGRGNTMNAAWKRSYSQVALHAENGSGLPEQRKLYIGSLFSQEFPTESGGLLNPGLCVHADQSRLTAGSTRFLLVVDGLGGDRTSSMIFREAVIDSDYHIHLHGSGCRPNGAEPVTNAVMSRGLIFRQLHDLGFDNAWTRGLMQSLRDEFTRADLESAMGTASGATRTFSNDSKASMKCLRWLAGANYEIEFDPLSDLSDRVLLPLGVAGAGGLHKGCFTLLTAADGDQPVYLAACTSCNGYRDLPLLLESRDLVNFKVSLLSGGASRSHGMAIFPQRFAGRHAAICGRSDDSLYLMYSKNPGIWETAFPVKSPEEPWEALGIQPCGAPMATVAGWLVLYRACGEMGREAIGAMLLHRDDPSKILGALKQPLMESPSSSAANALSVALQSYGALIHRERLLVAYTVQGREIEIAQFELDSLLSMLVESEVQ